MTRTLPALTYGHNLYNEAMNVIQKIRTKIKKDAVAPGPIPMVLDQTEEKK